MISMNVRYENTFESPQYMVHIFTIMSIELPICTFTTVKEYGIPFTIHKQLSHYNPKLAHNLVSVPLLLVVFTKTFKKLNTETNVLCVSDTINCSFYANFLFVTHLDGNCYPLFTGCAQINLEIIC